MFAFRLKDFCKVDFSDEEFSNLKELFPGKEKEGDLTRAFCEEIQKQVDHHSDSGVFFMNEKNKKPSLFSYGVKDVFTKGYCGVISLSINGSDVTVTFDSRFDKNNSFFLLHVFEVAFGIKGMVYDDMKVDGKREYAWDYMLMLLFLKQAHDAFKNSVYKEYREFDHNDSNIKGRIDIARHIKENMLNNGKVAYSTREYTPDNYVNILILKAFDRLQKKYRSAISNYIKEDDVIGKGFNTLKVEISSYQDLSDDLILKKTNRKIVKNVFIKYEDLRQTAVFILKRYGVNGFVQNSNRSNGILIDMPGLWEQYLHKMLFYKMDEKSEKEYRQDPYHILFEETDGIPGKPMRDVKPDYLINYQGRKYVFDAKYKLYWSNALKNDEWDKSRDDVFQVMSYMYLFGCKYGGIVFPYDGDDNPSSIRKYYIGGGQENGIALTKEQMILIPIRIPQEDTWLRFKDKIQKEFEEKESELKTLMGESE